MELHFDLLRFEDIDELMEVELCSFPDPWSPELFQQEIKNRLAHYFTVRKEGRLVAYGGMWFIVDEAHITNIAVHEDHRNQGIGASLLTKMIDYAKIRKMKHMTLEVRVSNQKAQSLYEKYGFNSQGHRPHYYLDNDEDAIIMWKHL